VRCLSLMPVIFNMMLNIPGENFRRITNLTKSKKLRLSLIINNLIIKDNLVN
jgi:hypothetical protein